MEYLTRNGVSINVIEVCQQIYIFQNRKDETIWSKNNLQPGLSRSTNILIRISLFFSLSVQEAEKERRKKRKKEKNLVVSGGDDAFSESFVDRPKIIAPKPSVGRNESISSKV